MLHTYHGHTLAKSVISSADHEDHKLLLLKEDPNFHPTCFVTLNSSSLLCSWTMQMLFAEQFFSELHLRRSFAVTEYLFLDVSSALTLSSSRQCFFLLVSIPFLLSRISVGLSDPPLSCLTQLFFLPSNGKRRWPARELGSTYSMMVTLQLNEAEGLTVQRLDILSFSAAPSFEISDFALRSAFQGRFLKSCIAEEQRPFSPRRLQPTGRHWKTVSVRWTTFAANWRNSKSSSPRLAGLRFSTKPSSNTSTLLLRRGRLLFPILHIAGSAITTWTNSNIEN